MFKKCLIFSIFKDRNKGMVEDGVIPKKEFMGNLQIHLSRLIQ